MIDPRKRKTAFISIVILMTLIVSLFFNAKLQFNFAIKTHHSRLLSFLVKHHGDAGYPYLVNASHNEDWTVRMMAITSVRYYSGSTIKANSLIRDALLDPSLHVRACALETATFLGPPCHPLVPEICNALENDPRLIEGAWMALERVSLTTIDAISVLERIAKQFPDRNEQILQRIEELSHQN